MQLNNDKKNCTACGACSAICPVQAITMLKDEKGFLYPQINEDKCINCGNCVNVCPMKDNTIESDDFCKRAYAVKTKDIEVRKNSTSGGVFWELSKYILQKKGIVYGACFDDNFQVVHARGETCDDVRKMQGSKYIQSKMNGIYELVKEDLLSGRYVLFSGCPCQIDGLNHYLKNYKTDKLFTCDLICHGVNSSKYWNDYLNFVSKKGKIQKICFRDKSLGWRNIYMNIQTSKKSYIETESYDYFYQAFFGAYIMRDSCYSCKYANIHRRGDITIGDFWGIENVYPDLDDNQGVSLSIINSLKGKKLFYETSDSFITKEVTIQQCMQPALKKPVMKSQFYESFWNDYQKKGFNYVCKKYLNGDLKGKIKRLIKGLFIKIGLWENLKTLQKQK